MRSRRPVRRGAPGVAVCLAGAWLGAAGCGGGATNSGSGAAPPASFPALPAETLDSVSAAFHLEVRWSPVMPIRGTDAAEISIFDAAGGAPAEDLQLVVVPWMPAHGHGTSVQPMVELTAPGVFVVQPLVLFMSGTWQLRMTLTGTKAGAPVDAAVSTVEIP